MEFRVYLHVLEGLYQFTVKVPTDRECNSSSSVMSIWTCIGDGMVEVCWRRCGHVDPATQVCLYQYRIDVVILFGVFTTEFCNIIFHGIREEIKSYEAPYHRSVEEKQAQHSVNKKC